MRPVRRIDFLDHVRGLAILGVMVFHAVEAAFGHQVWREGPAWLRPASLGSLGVAVFFVVSGFCIHTSHAGSAEPGLGRFFLRRFFRIYPPYLFALALFAVGRDFSLPQLVSHAGLFHNFDARWFQGINPSFWSIAVEWQLYCAYPLFYFAALRWGWTPVLAVLATIEVSLVLLERTIGLPVALRHSVLGYGCSWAAGAALADAWLRGSPLPFRALWHRLLWPVLTLVPVCFAPRYALLSFLFGALSTVSWISWALSRPATATPAPSRLRPLAFIGACSYSLYLLHQPLLRALSASELPPLQNLAWLFLLFVPIILLAHAAYRLIELPSIALGRIISRLVVSRPSYRAQPAP
jgi:Predicted acyltransferases